MTPEETFHQLLGLGQGWKVVRTEFEQKEQTFVICVEETERLWPEESQRCGQEVSCYDHVEPMQWRHLNVFNKECVIVSALPRGKRKFKATTNSSHGLPVSPNLLARRFDVEAPDRVWTGDITYVWTEEGWLYLAIVIDLFSRQVVGFAMSDRMTRQLVIDALRMAWFRRQSANGLIFHSDRGSQYASGDFQKQLSTFGMRGSMSRKGDCWDNAVTETLFGSLKVERLHGMRFATRRQAKDEVIDWLQFYNHRRLHSTLGYLSPMAFEKKRLADKERLAA